MTSMKQARPMKIKALVEAVDAFDSTLESGNKRVAFSEAEIAAKAYLINEMKLEGLTVREDCLGNVFATLEGREPHLPPVWTGSHIDTVDGADLFDGVAGVVAGLEALHILREDNNPFRRSVSLVVCRAEEPTRFGLCCMGSRAIAGLLTLEHLDNYPGWDGLNLRTMVRKTSGQEVDLDSVKAGPVHSWIEIHVESGHELARLGIPIGITTSVCEPEGYVVEIVGCRSDHGGNQTQDRRDAYAASCDIARHLEELIPKSVSTTATYTFGTIQTMLGVPGGMMFSLDIRGSDPRNSAKLARIFKSGLGEIERQHNVQVTLHPQGDEEARTCDRNLTELLRSCCKHRQIPYLEKNSGTYHDTLFLSHIAPAGMLYLPSREATPSNNERMYRDIAQGTDILVDALRVLANQ